MTSPDSFTDPVTAGTFYVARVLDPFRVPMGKEGKMAVDGAYVRTVDRLVDLFGPDIKEQQIQPNTFLSAVVGSAALIGINLPDPRTPSQFKLFAEQASGHLDAYYDSIAAGENTI